MTQPPYDPSQQQPYQGQPGWPQQPPYGQQPQGQWAGPQHGYMPPAGPPPRKNWFARHKVLTIVGGIVGLFILLAVVPLGSSSSPAGTGAASSPPASAFAENTPSASASSSPPAPSAPSKVTFIVSGSAPEGVNISYGPAGTSLAGPSVLDGTYKVSVPFAADDSYYNVTAQLQGGGHLTCKIVVSGPGDQPLTVSHGAASGGYNICMAEAASYDRGFNWHNLG
jgi:hypothetical protein